MNTITIDERDALLIKAALMRLKTPFETHKDKLDTPNKDRLKCLYVLKNIDDLIDKTTIDHALSPMGVFILEVVSPA